MRILEISRLGDRHFLCSEPILEQPRQFFFESGFDFRNVLRIGNSPDGELRELFLCAGVPKELAFSLIILDRGISYWGVIASGFVAFLVSKKK